jgi:predicted nucleic acid-binding Zn ribbon protein
MVMDNRCVMCGAIIPEGKQVCLNCEIKCTPKYIPAGNNDITHYTIYQLLVISEAERLNLIDHELYRETIKKLLQIIFDDLRNKE